MLMSMGLPLPKKVFGHGFLTKDGLKMGKALGNILEPRTLVSSLEDAAPDDQHAPLAAAATAAAVAGGCRPFSSLCAKGEARDPSEA